MSEEEKISILRYQKVLSSWKRKFNQLLQTKKKLIEKNLSILHEGENEQDDEDETDDLLQGMKIEVS